MIAPAAAPQPSQHQPSQHRPLPASMPQTILNVINRLAASGRLSPAAADELRQLYGR